MEASQQELEMEIRAKKLTTRRSFTLNKTGEAFEVEITIDLEEIAHTLAARAVHNKNRKASAMNGDIRCRVVDRNAA